MSSDVLQLIPESEETSFLVHESLLASQSEHLKNLIKAIPEECSTSHRQLDVGCWGATTVGRFVEFVYTGDYHCPDPVPLYTPVVTPGVGSVSGHGKEEQSTEDAVADPLPAESARVKELKRQIEKLKQKSAPRRLAPLSEIFASDFLDPQRKASAAETFATKYFHPTEHDFEEVFLVHAKVYAIALTLEVQALRTLALQRLLRTLINIDSVPPDSPLVSNFVELVRYSYSATFETQDPLRHIVSQFAALNFTSMQTQEMRGLMKNGGDFPSDLMEKVSMRIASEEDAEAPILAESSPKATNRCREEEENLRKEMEELRRELLEGSTRVHEYIYTEMGLVREQLGLEAPPPPPCLTTRPIPTEI